MSSCGGWDTSHDRPTLLNYGKCRVRNPAGRLMIEQEVAIRAEPCTALTQGVLFHLWK